jgi:hypothetical protein
MQPRCAPRTGLLAGLAACAAIALAGCTEVTTTVRLPPKGSPTHPAVATKPRALSERQQVVAAFTGYNDALRTAGNSRSPAEVRRLMRPYLPASTISNLIKFDQSIWAKGELFYGHIARHIVAVRIAGRHAFVYDCDNTSEAGLEYARTGQVVPGALVIRDDNVITRLNLVSGRWLVGIQTIEDVPCKP